MNTCGDVVREFLDVQRLTLREFADQLSEKMDVRLSHVSIIQWRDGVRDPNTDFLLACYNAYEDWRRDFALDCLLIKHAWLAEWLVEGGNGRS